MLIPKSPNPHTYFKLHNPVYKDFMVEMMQYLEPKYEHADKIIFEELEEVTFVLLFLDGKFDIGYELNGVQHFVLRYTNC